MERLTPGHPSSPYTGDGARRPSTPDQVDQQFPIPGDFGYQGKDRPSDVGLPTASDTASSDDAAPDTEPITDNEYAEHVREVRQRLDQARAEGLATDEKFARDPDAEIWSRERAAVHVAIVDEMYGRGADVPNQHRALIAGGLPGAGKTTVLEGYAGIDRSRFFTIDPDEIKLEMATRRLIPAVEGLSPMEASDLVHEESSHIAKRIAHRAQADGKNVIWDITMSSKGSAQRRIDDLRSAGYSHIEGVFVDIPLATSEARATARHRIGQDEYRAGKGEGGRLIPADLIRRSADQDWGSVNRRTFEEVKHTFDKWSLYDNSVDGRAPTLMDSSELEERRR